MIESEIYKMEELREMSGYHQTGKICQWLDKYGVPYLKSRTGIPLVHRSAMRIIMGGAPAETDNNGKEPNFDAL